MGEVAAAAHQRTGCFFFFFFALLNVLLPWERTYLFSSCEGMSDRNVEYFYSTSKLTLGMVEPFLLPPGGEEKKKASPELCLKKPLPLQPEWLKIARASNMPTFLEANLSFSNYLGNFYL